MEEKFETPAAEEETLTEDGADIKPRKPWVAFILSLLTPGLGQIYNGQLKKGLLFLGLLFIPLIIASAKFIHNFNGFAWLVLVELLLRLYIIVDSIRFAKTQTEFIPKKYNSWYYHLLFASGIVSLFQIFPPHKVLRIHSFNISTESNMPAMMPDDKVVANLEEYNGRKPQYGELVAFNSPQGGVWTFRVVGLPGDKIDFDGSFLTVNAKKCKVTRVGSKEINGWPMIEYVEELPNGYKHHILLYNGDDGGKRESRQLTVPQDSFYLMGDNRDNALDSRFIGPIGGENILGRLLYTYWGDNIDRINIDLTRQ